MASVLSMYRYYIVALHSSSKYWTGFMSSIRFLPAPLENLVPGSDPASDKQIFNSITVQSESLVIYMHSFLLSADFISDMASFFFHRLAAVTLRQIFHFFCTEVHVSALFISSFS